MKTCLILGLCLAGATASAQSVYRCRDAAGALVYQSQACAGTAEKQWNADPGLSAASSAEWIAAGRSIARDRQPMQPGACHQRHGARLRIQQTRPMAAAPSACERQRKARADAHARKGVRWSFDDASRWDARVFKVCR